MLSEQVEQIEAAIGDLAAKPAEVSGDAGSVKMHSLDELIKAAKYLASAGSASTKKRGLRFSKLVPPGAV